MGVGEQPFGLTKSCLDVTYLPPIGASLKNMLSNLLESRLASLSSQVRALVLCVRGVKFFDRSMRQIERIVNESR